MDSFGAACSTTPRSHNLPLTPCPSLPPLCVGAVLLMPMALFSGLLLDMQSISPALSWFQYVSIIRYAYHAIIINEFRASTM